jgi:signal transduction histidine kinase
MRAPRTPNFSISGRLTRMNMLVSGAALLLACLAFLSYDVYNFRDILIRNLAAQAQIIGTNSVSAIMFNDPQAARTTLSALKDSPGILSAGIFTPDGHIFAEYSRTHEMTLKVPTIPSGATEAHVFYPNEVVFVHAVTFQGQTIGVVYLRSDLREIQKRFLRYLLIAAVVLVLSLLAALLVSAGFRRSVATPIISLAETARSISQNENYGLRVDVNQEFSEIATLDAAFNEMLTQIQRRDTALQTAQQQLEQRVEERTRQLAAANRELESFAYSVSHDLRNPLDILSNYTYLLQEKYGDRLDGQGNEYVTQMGYATLRMADLIEDLLDLSRMTIAPMHREPVDLTTMARSISEELQRHEPRRNVEFAIQDSLLGDGDSRLLRIVLENLLRNAWKYTSGHEKARIEVGSRKEGRAVVYYVRDDGAGFDLRRADQLFKPFQRLHTTAEFPGSGIGLATVQRIIHRHGGEIWADGAVEEGATFFFTLQT